MQSETFCINAHGVAKYLLSRAVRDAGYKVVLTGEGSDEILGGYAHFRRDMLLYNREGQDADEVAALLERSGARQSGLARTAAAAWRRPRPLEHVRRLLGFVPSWIETFSARAAKMQDLLSADFSAEFGHRESYHPLLSDLDVRDQLQGRDPVNQSLYLWSKTLLPTYILTVLGDRMEMAHSIEGRVPFLDHHVVEVIRSQPVSQKIHGMTEKYVLREAVRDVITDTVYRRQKHPFLSPPATLNPDGKLSALVNDTLRGSDAGLDSFLRPEESRRAAGRRGKHGRRIARRQRSDPDVAGQRLRSAGWIADFGLTNPLVLDRIRCQRVTSSTYCGARVVAAVSAEASFSNRGSPRSESNIGSRRSSGAVLPDGRCSTGSIAVIAASRSPARPCTAISAISALGRWIASSR